VEPLGELPASRTESEQESASGQLVEAGGQHREGASAAAPDVDHAGPDPDSVGAGGDLSQQHRRVVAPRLGDEERGVAEFLGADGQAHDDLPAGLQGGDAHGERSVLGHWRATFLAWTTFVISGMSTSPASGAKPASRSRAPRLRAENDTLSAR
jgi:hypothetical protein